jgi:hypothetical protein
MRPIADKLLKGGGTGSSSGRLRGSISFAVYAAGTTNGPDIMRRFFPSAVRGSAGSRCAERDDGPNVHVLIP